MTPKLGTEKGIVKELDSKTWEMYETAITSQWSWSWFIGFCHVSRCHVSLPLNSKVAPHLVSQSKKHHIPVNVYWIVVLDKGGCNVYSELKALRSLFLSDPLFRGTEGI